MRVMRRYVNYCCDVRTVPRVAELAAILSMPRETLSRRFRSATGRCPAAVFRTLQLKRARALLTKSDGSTADIAAATAFGSARAFYRAFLREVGITPTAYRRRSRGGKQ